MLHKLDDYLNKITMYKLLLWMLRILFVISWIFSAVGLLPFGFLRPLISISILIAVSLVTNYSFAKRYHVAPNSESTNITALLLYFIFQPPKSTIDCLALGLAGAFAVASKYFLTRYQRHIVNPAAFGAIVVGVTGLLTSRWWVGSDVMFPYVLVFALLVVRKIHRFPMVVGFGITATWLALMRSDAGLGLAFRDALLSFPILFFGGFMLTEPVTTPPRKFQQIFYGVLVGILFSSGARVGSISMTPELSLIIGNIFVFALSSRRMQPLKFKSRDEIAKTIFEYRFTPLAPLNYTAGQYLELTLPLKKTDFRGNRRSFTIASAPEEKELLLGVKQIDQGSAFKKALSEITAGNIVSANNIAGDFVLPTDTKSKLVFIAGGIGVAPFRSMIKHLIENNHHRNIVLFYAVSDAKQIAFKDIFNQAKELGVKTVYVLSPNKEEKVPSKWNGEVGYLNKEMITKHVLDYKDRTFYISGPDAMVKANKQLIKNLGIARSKIKTDYFSGY